jgi:hypothetical protein
MIVLGAALIGGTFFLPFIEIFLKKVCLLNK